MIVAILLLGAAYAVLGFRETGGPTDRTRAELQRLVTDAVTVLSGLRDDRGRELDADVLEALHCSGDAAPSATSCRGGLGSNLSLKLGSYLPTGASYAVTLSNGLRARDVYRTGAPSGEAVAASVAYAPDWNLTFVLPELSCYDPAMDVNATLVPLANGAIANVSAGNATMDSGANATLTNATTISGARNVTLSSGAARPAAGNVTANLSSKRGTLPGSAHYESCAIGAATGNALVAALRASTLAPANGVASAGTGSVTFAANLAPLAGVAGATLGETRLIVVEPLQGRRDAPDSWLTALNATLPSGSTPSFTWNVPANVTFGVHPVVLSANVTVGGTTLQARLLTTLTVALPSGVVPVQAPYRLGLQVWIQDWR